MFKLASSFFSMALAPVPAPASDRVFAVPELLEAILSQVDKTDLLVNMQRVSKHWKKVIEGSPKFQKALFFLASSGSPTPHKRYLKNLRLASVVQPFFSVDLLAGGLSDDKRFSHIWMRDIVWHLDSDIKPKWLVEDASWRNMYVSQPPIKRLHWQIQREDQESYGLSLPGTVAELEFPGGLRMGDYYDLILGTRGTHKVIWPSPTGKVHAGDDMDDEARWLYYERRRAHEQHAIMIKQLVSPEEDNPDPRRDDYWNPQDLQRYHKNLRMVKGLDVKMTDGDVSWRYNWLGNDSASGMRLFLHAAQKFIPDDVYYY
ncbi:putative f-box domain protein [Daldinia childiae]|uniref:putative f-box domain protein n=1 Tax=Daldinia childiae TaxID=326645 RepID=UPI0014468E68|nr:putative f-box domain protein [Daldinia childiae]KAF3059957.1 putative f-box domain protein [Daldinia childiae]